MEPLLLEHYEKDGRTWFGRVKSCEHWDEDLTIEAGTHLVVHNRKGDNHIVLEGHREFHENHLLEILEYFGEIVRIRGPHRIARDFYFLSEAGERPWAYNLRHDVEDCLERDVHYHYCKHPSHWFFMSTSSRQLFLGQGYGASRSHIDDFGKEKWYPLHFDHWFWEALANKLTDEQFALFMTQEEGYKELFKLCACGHCYYEHVPGNLECKVFEPRRIFELA